MRKLSTNLDYMSMKNSNKNRKTHFSIRCVHVIQEQGHVFVSHWIEQDTHVVDQNGKESE